MYVIVYNGLASSHSTIVHLPVSTNTTYTVSRLDKPAGEELQLLQAVPNSKGTAFVLKFDTGELPPVGAAVLRVSMANDTHNALHMLQSSAESRILQSFEGDEVEVTNGLITARFDRCVRLSESAISKHKLKEGRF